jgi:hypothetical protein
MIELAVAAAALAVGLLVGVVLVWDHRPASASSWLQGVVRRRLLVHTRDGQTIDGQLVRVDADGLVLGPAQWEGVDVGGEVWVPRERVAWCQQPPASE